MWLRKFTERSRIKGCDILIRGRVKNPSEDADKTKDKGITNTINISNKLAYQKLKPSQQETVYFQISK